LLVSIFQSINKPIKKWIIDPPINKATLVVKVENFNMSCEFFLKKCI
jgi:hypothetical protein